MASLAALTRCRRPRDPRLLGVHRGRRARSTSTSSPKARRLSAKRAEVSRRRSSGRCCSSAIATAIALPFGVLTRDLRQRVRAAAVGAADPALARRPERLPVDRDRHLRLHAVVKRAPSSAGHHQSAFAGGFALAIIMLPLVARATMEVLALVPNELREASYALGVSKWQTVLRVVLPTAFGGILTGTTLAIARAAGETAPLLFTCAIAGQIVDWNPSHSVNSIPLRSSRTPSRPTRAARAGLGARLRPDRVRARDEPDRRASCSSARGASSALTR